MRFWLVDIGEFNRTVQTWLNTPLKSQLFTTGRLQNSTRDSGTLWKTQLFDFSFSLPLAKFHGSRPHHRNNSRVVCHWVVVFPVFLVVDPISSEFKLTPKVFVFIITEKARAKERKWNGVGVMKDKEMMKLEDVKDLHTLKKSCNSIFMNLSVFIFIRIKKDEGQGTEGV